MLSQTLLERVDVLDCLRTVYSETSLVETDITVAARTVRMVLDATRFDNGSRWLIPSLLSEASDWIGSCRLVG